MSSLTKDLRDLMGYTCDKAPKCKDCGSCKLDDNGAHGGGGLCIRNPDIVFIVSGNARCDKFTKREVKANV